MVEVEASTALGIRARTGGHRAVWVYGVGVSIPQVSVLESHDAYSDEEKKKGVDDVASVVSRAVKTSRAAAVIWGLTEKRQR